ncbi:outer membrane beta-barrel protein [Motilimonas pumila]|uniref:Outer membrane protein beta-barrel domain-containing protein n=1 Tax=Motilimonas pumila TaxID=2303987 RepID=A0A418YK37_9GAMM|nr:outer membrane beta-barrel protein [Motilimonas pumila]RJG51341.1 hypothetical protein D1Z90_00995 [Motilimonas pumila]
MKFCRIISFCMPLLLSAPSLAETDVEIGLGTQSQLKTTTHISSDWYVSSFAGQRYDEADPNSQDESESFDFYSFNGGYQYQIVDKLNLFMEAGLASYVPESSQSVDRGINVATGVNYNITDNFKVETRLSHTATQESDSKLEFSGFYRILDTLDVKASFDMQMEASKMQLGLGYRF